MDSKKMGFTGLMTAISAILLAFAAFVPSGKLTLLFLSTLAISLILLKCGTKFAVLSYFATAIIGWVLSSTNVIVIGFIIFFGYYPIAKFFIEKKNNLFFEWIIKLLIYNIALIVLNFIIPNIPLWLYLLSEIFFVLYDLLYTYLIGYIVNRWQKFLY